MCRFYATTDGYDAARHAAIHASNANAIPPTNIHCCVVYCSE